jgi:hypothetical protein
MAPWGDQVHPEESTTRQSGVIPLSKALIWLITREMESPTRYYLPARSPFITHPLLLVLSVCGAIVVLAGVLLSNL